MKRLQVLLFAVLSLLGLQSGAQAESATAPRSACMHYPFKPPSFNFSVTFAPSPPNCRSVRQSAVADLTTRKGLHFGADVFSVERIEDDGSTDLQRVSVARPKGWTIGVEETLDRREDMAERMFTMLGLEGRRSVPAQPLAHYVRITVDGLPGVEVGGSADIDDFDQGVIHIRSRFVWAYILVDRPGNLAYFVTYLLDVPGRGKFETAEAGFRFVESFHVKR
jgi:hypothetical protein